MADSPPPPLPPPPAARTTITALSDDILREIFLCLPDITTLARAAFACPAFLRAVRSSPAFRRRFRELHAPPLLALLLAPHMHAIIPEGAGKSVDIGDIAAAFVAFYGILEVPYASEPEWRIDPQFSYSNGYAAFVNWATDQCACYSPHSQALSIYPKNDEANNDALLEFHTLYLDGEEQRPSRLVCVHRDRAWAWARVAVFSSRTMERQVVLPHMELVDYDEDATATVVNGFVCWMHRRKGCILALNTATFQLKTENSDKRGEWEPIKILQ